MEGDTHQRAVAEVRALATAYLAGELPPIEAALDLDVLCQLMACIPVPVRETLSLISSETAAIPVGVRRELWHPDVRAAENQKHDRAQAWAQPLMDEVCVALLQALPG